MLSFWEQHTWLNTDVIIVGAGIIGLSTAISVKERSPRAKVIVLERGIFPSGATTRNAGFACFGSLTEILSDIQKNGEETTKQLVEKRWRGLQILRTRLGNDAMQFEQHGGYETLFENQLSALESLDVVNTLLAEIFPSPTFVLRNEQISTFGFDTNRVKALVYSPFEGQIHSGQMMQALMRLATAKGVDILTGADVQEVREENGVSQVIVRHLGENIQFRCAECVIATNSFIPHLAEKHYVPNNTIKPARGQVLVTSPIQNLPFRGVFHLDEGFYYFRSLTTPEGQRILLGGGRNLAFEEEESYVTGLNPAIHNELDKLLRTTIAPMLTYSIEYRWAGIMGFRSDKLPEVRRVSPHCTVAFGCNGMGVALGSIIGSEAASILEL